MGLHTRTHTHKRTPIHIKTKAIGLGMVAYVCHYSPWRLLRPENCCELRASLVYIVSSGCPEVSKTPTNKRAIVEE